MKCWRNHLIIKIVSYLVLGLMVINPALALQYQHYNTTTDFISQLPNHLPKAYHIHASQKDDVLALLKKQGYDVVPANQTDLQHFLTSNSLPDSTIQLAANRDIEPPPQDECIARCPPECTDDDFYNNYGCPESCLKQTKKTPCKGEDCPDQEKPQLPECTETDPVERAKDRKPVPEPVVEKPAPRTSGSVTINRGFQMPNINMGGGNKGDAAAVMLIVIGVVVIAALIVYAGKYIIDLFSGDSEYYAYWWDIGTQFISLDTEAGQHGNFTGIKFTAGFVANRSAQFGLAAEVGNIDLDLNYNRNSTPQRIRIDGTYWLLGATVRWLLGNVDPEQSINNSYVYFELLAGASDRDEVDKMAVARVGFNTGLGKHMRLGIHYGAFYLGLDEDQGVANDGDNYWNMVGMEIGYQF